MIDNKMENAFKADLNGWLEHESKYPSITESDKRKDIYENFESTMNFFGATEQAQEALHNVIFYALINEEDYETDFDVPRFENGLNYSDYAGLIQDYNLFTFTKRELWKMDTEVRFITTSFSILY
ncbi:hypothetical protein BD770DRAFT_246580 [Pilaira anomala]|nr:hypothetical protein BD770DRAFT_246580 [Pilaira anomala]